MEKTLNRVELDLGGGSLLQLSNRSHVQMMSYVICTPEGKTVVIDGGWESHEDAEYLEKVILERGGKVDLWMMTHAHQDHYGALLWLLQNHSPLPFEIADIRFSFPPPEWVGSVDAAREMDAMRRFFAGIKAYEPKSLHFLDRIECGGMSFEIISNGPKYEDYSSVNDTSMVIRADFPKRSVLFLGDLGVKGGKELLRVCPPEKYRCDIVQMAHHGQNGVDRDFYEKVSPKICLYCAPDWLWENDDGGGRGSGPWNTLLTREWMDSLGVSASFPIAYGDYLFT